MSGQATVLMKLTWGKHSLQASHPQHLSVSTTTAHTGLCNKLEVLARAVHMSH